MCDPVSASMGMQLAGGAMQAQNQLSEGKQAQKYYDHLASQNQKQMDLVDENAQENIHSIRVQASKDIDKNGKEYQKLIASQKAAMAANGVYSDSGTAQDIVDDSLHKQKLDELAIRYNSSSAVIQEARNAINQKNQLSAEIASNKIKGSNARASSKINAMSTLIGSATQAASTYATTSKYQKTNNRSVVLDNSNWSIA